MELVKKRQIFYKINENNEKVDYHCEFCNKDIKKTNYYHVNTKEHIRNELKAISPESVVEKNTYVVKWCDLCETNISYFAYHKHIKSKKHSLIKKAIEKNKKT